MAMSYNSLVAPKGTSGSLATWVSYTKVDFPTVVDEAQALLFETLRCREMMTEFLFRIPAGNFQVALPARFRDPIGKMLCTTQNRTLRHKDQNDVLRNQTYSTTSGSLGAAPLTTTNGSGSITVARTAHNFSQGGVFTMAAATAVGGLTPNGTFPITSITDANNFVIDASSLGTATSSATGGGSAITYSCDSLIPGPPDRWAIWDEKIKFDCALNEDNSFKLLYFQALPLLSVSNPTNFLTDRYPNLLRCACTASAADFMKDNIEGPKEMTRLGALIQRVNIENEGYLRGAEIDTETP